MIAEGPPVVIVGGGVIGLCCAYYLRKAGCQVTLMDRDNISAGCSFGNAGLLVPSHSIPVPQPGILAKGLCSLFNSESAVRIKFRPSLDLFYWLIDFSAASNIKRMRQSARVLGELIRASMELHNELVRIEQFDCGYERRGILGVYLTRKGFDQGIEEAELLNELNVNATVLDAAATLKVEPMLRPNVHGGVFYSDDAQLIPELFVNGLNRIVEDMGVSMYRSAEVLNFEVSGRKITSVETTHGFVEPQEVVLAAGSWSPRLLNALQIKLPIQPARGYSITCDRTPNAPNIPLLLAEARVAVTPMKDKLRVSSGFELGEFDLAVNPDRLRLMLRLTSDYLVMQEDLPLSKPWNGLRPCTPDGLPIIARPKQFENLVVASGHGMLGMTLGPITGLLVSQLIGRLSPSVDLTPFRLERF